MYIYTTDLMSQRTFKGVIEFETKLPNEVKFMVGRPAFLSCCHRGDMPFFQKKKTKSKGILFGGCFSSLHFSLLSLSLFFIIFPPSAS